MALGAASSQGSGGEDLIHVGPIRFRVNGSGNLRLSLYTLDNEKSITCPNPIVMQTTTRIEPTKLFNIITQRVKLKLSTTEINEYFKINRVVIFAKVVFTDYPRVS